MMSMTNPEKPVGGLRRSARISSATYKSAAAPAQREPSTSTIRRWFKKKKPKSKFSIDAGITALNSKWTESQRAQRFFGSLCTSLSRKMWRFSYGPDNEERTCILPSGDTFTWTDNSCGTTWIALRGITAYVVVAMDPRLEHESSVREYCPGIHPPVNFALLTVLNQMGEPSSTFNQAVAHHAQGKPFAVVSTAPETFEDPQERRQAFSRAIDFLKANLHDCSDLTCEKILKIGVCALKEMFGPNFKSNRIVRAYYDRLGWNGGCKGLSTTEVDECLKEIKAKATRNDAEKINSLYS